MKRSHQLYNRILSVFITLLRWLMAYRSRQSLFEGMHPWLGHEGYYLMQKRIGCDHAPLTANRSCWIGVIRS